MYKLYNYNGKEAGAFYTQNGQQISFCFNDPDNTDYQAYLKWLEEGGVPEPAEEQ
jgi:hypothetical protein